MAEISILVTGQDALDLTTKAREKAYEMGVFPGFDIEDLEVDDNFVMYVYSVVNTLSQVRAQVIVRPDPRAMPRLRELLRTATWAELNKRNADVPGE